MTTPMTDRSRYGTLVKAARRLVACYDWLSVPPMTERQRRQPVIASLEKARRDFYPF
jgi:hypothetical protein